MSKKVPKLVIPAQKLCKLKGVEFNLTVITAVPKTGHFVGRSDDGCLLDVELTGKDIGVDDVLHFDNTGTLINITKKEVPKAAPVQQTVEPVRRTGSTMVPRNC